MSESVKIGGIGIRTNVDGLAYGKKVPIDFTKVDWEGSKDGK